jgi:peptidoglycan/LPS O-acetylase OafA/YrhL
MTQQGAPQAHQYAGLDGLRGLAALAVLSAHSAMLFSHTPRHFALAVDFFFLLSGFVLCHAYQARLQQGLSAAGFLRLRLIRLYPLYALGTVIGFVHAACAPHSAESTALPTLLGRLLLGLAFIPADSISPERWLYPLDQPGWSLLFELFANALFGLLWLRLLRRPAALGALLGASALLLLAAGLAFSGFDLGWSSDNAAASVPRVLFSFFLGALLYRCSLRWPPWRVASAWPFLLLAAALALHLPWERADVWLQAGLIGLLSPLILWLGAGARPQGFAAWLCRETGRSSYAVYVLHVPLFFALRDSAAHFGYDLSRTAPWGGLAYTVALVGLCLLLDRCYDEPLRRMLARLGRRPPAAAPLMPAAGKP